MKIKIALALFLVCGSLLYSQEIVTGFESIITTGVVTSNDVRIRSSPGLNGKILEKVSAGTEIYICGTSLNKDTINNVEEYWYHIGIKSDYTKIYYPIRGWIFGQYIDRKEELKHTSIVIDNKKNTVTRNETNEILKYSDTIYYLGEKYIAFYWDGCMKGFKYTDTPGIHIIDKNSGKTISVLPSYDSCESGPLFITEDGKYILKDGGTSSGIRGLSIFNLKNQEYLYSVNYYDDFQLNGYEIIVSYNIWSLNRNKIMTTDIQNKIDEYIRINKIKTSEREIIVQFNFNIETQERKILKIIDIVQQ